MRHAGRRTGTAIVLAALCIAPVLATTPAGAGTNEPAATFVGSLGSYGTDAAQFRNPEGISVDGNGNLYVADTGNHSVKKFGPDGTFLLAWAVTGTEVQEQADLEAGFGSVFDLVSVPTLGLSRVVRYSPTGAVLDSWGDTGPHHLSSHPQGLELGPDGYVYVADSLAHQIQVFTTSGAWVRALPTPGAPTGVAVDPDGELLVPIADSDVILRLSASGTLLDTWDALQTPLYGRTAIEIDAVGTVWVGSQENPFDQGPEAPVWRYRADGTAMGSVPVTDVWDVAFTAERRVAMLRNAPWNAPSVQVWQAGTGALADVGLTARQTSASVGGHITYEGAVRNTGTVPLVGVSVADPSAPECAQSLPDIAVGATSRFECTHAVVAGDVGTFANTATISFTGGTATSDPAPVTVEDNGGLRLVRTITGLPTKGNDLAVLPDGGFVVNQSNRALSFYDQHGTSTGGIASPDPANRGLGVEATPNGDLYPSYFTTDSLGNDTAQVDELDAPGHTNVRTVVHHLVKFEDVAVDGDDGVVYAAGRPGNRCYDPDGPFGTCAALSGSNVSVVDKILPNGTVQILATAGSDDGQVSSPVDVAVGSGQVYVADRNNDRIVTLNAATGAFVRNLAMASPDSVAVGPSGVLYAMASEQPLVRAFAPDGTPLGSAPVPVTSAPGTFQSLDLDFDAAGRLYVLDAAAHTVRIFAGGFGVSGQVTETVTGDPVGGAWVAALRLSDFGLAGSAVAGADGSYHVALPPGDFLLYVIDPSADHRSRFFGRPSIVTVPAGRAATADPVLDRLRGAVRGTVEEAGGGPPVSGALVLGLSGSGQMQTATVADGSGLYRIDDVAAGNHLLAAVDPTGAHRPSFYPDAATAQGASSLTVVAGRTTTADPLLPAQAAADGGATLTGTVSDTTSGVPLAGVEVLALRAADFSFVRGGTTAGDGTYSLSVPAGPYKLALVDTTGTHTMEWYDHQPPSGLAGAATVTAPGATNTSLTAGTGAIAGTVTSNAAPVAGAWVVAIGPTGIAGGAVTAAGGTFAIAGLAPGTYRATVVDPTGAHPQEYWHDAGDYAGATPVTVTAAHTTTIAPDLG